MSDDRVAADMTVTMWFWNNPIKTLVEMTKIIKREGGDVSSAKTYKGFPESKVEITLVGNSKQHIMDIIACLVEEV